MDQELLKLKDIHLPHAIVTWPTAPGWISLYVLLLASILFFSIWWYLRYKRRYTVKHALARLNKLKELNKHNPDNINIALEISTLIRRTALHYFKRNDIAGLSGTAWLAFLNRSGDTDHFTGETGRLLLDAPYRQHYSANIDPLFTSTRSWLNAIASQKIKRQEK